MLRVRPLPAIAFALALAACGGHKSPSSPSPAAPQITCPADIAISKVASATQVVTFDPPTVAGGAQPVQTTCDPASGAAFPLGTTTVNCTATDASSRTAMCSFKVSLKGYSIAATTFEAFGDSLTAGETGRPGILAQFDDTANAYPTKLEQALQATYSDQEIVVINQGHNGDKVEVTEQKIRDVVPADKPDVVLLLSGYNNLTFPCRPGDVSSIPCRDAISSVGYGVRDCIRRVKESKAGVQFMFVSTLTPPGVSGRNRIDPDAIIEANHKIRQMVGAEGAVLVDAHAAFTGHEAEYVNVDGLHLTPAGYQALADVFFAAIQKKIPQMPLFRQP